MLSSQDVTGIYVTLNIDGVPSLLVMLDADGSINRFGTGAVDNAEKQMCIGIIAPTLFEDLRAQITPDLLRWIGGRAVPDPKGKLCQLSIGFTLANKQEHTILFRYGADSLGPPPEVKRFVLSAVETTNPWYEEFKAQTVKRQE